MIGKHFSWGVPHLVGGMTGSESQPLLIVTSATYCQGGVRSTLLVIALSDQD